MKTSNPKLSLNDTSLADLSEFVSKRFGLNFPEEWQTDLARRFQAASLELGFDDPKTGIDWLLSAPLSKRELGILAGHLTVGETYFFRDNRLFEVLEEHVLRPLIESRGKQGRFLRIWCAGCASGEEPYSLAMILRKMIPGQETWQVTLMATDINPHLLQKARQGVYSEWSFRNTPLWIRDQYFGRSSDNRWEILPAIRSMIDFVHHNLAEDPYPSLLNNTNAMDIIICRNVLMYFTPEQAKEVIQNFYNCLIDSGWLIVAPCETAAGYFPEFKTRRFPEVVLYQKGDWQSGVGDQGSGARGQVPGHEKQKSKQVLRIVPTRPIHDFGLQVASRPPIPDPQADLARYYANTGRLSEASACCRKAISTDRLNPSWHYLLASIFQEQGRIEEAIQSLKRVLYIDQDYVLAHFALGNLLAIQGKNQDSEKYFRNAIFILNKLQKEAILPGSEGLTAGSLYDLIHSMREKDNHG